MGVPKALVLSKYPSPQGHSGGKIAPGDICLKNLREVLGRWLRIQLAHDPTNRVSGLPHLRVDVTGLFIDIIQNRRQPEPHEPAP